MNGGYAECRSNAVNANISATITERCQATSITVRHLREVDFDRADRELAVDTMGQCILSRIKIVRNSCRVEGQSLSDFVFRDVGVVIPFPSRL
jgi:hypothetical protein